MKNYQLSIVLFLLFGSILQGQKTLPVFFEYDRTLASFSSRLDRSAELGSVYGTEFSVAQRVEITSFSGLADTEEISLYFQVFPNPFREFLVLKIEGPLPSNYSANLFDFNGNRLINESVVARETIFLTNDLLPGIYLLTVLHLEGSRSQQVIKSFKVVKK